MAVKNAHGIPNANIDWAKTFAEESKTPNLLQKAAHAFKRGIGSIAEAISSAFQKKSGDLTSLQKQHEVHGYSLRGSVAPASDERAPKTDSIAIPAGNPLSNLRDPLDEPSSQQAGRRFSFIDPDLRLPAEVAQAAVPAQSAPEETRTNSTRRGLDYWVDMFIHGADVDGTIEPGAKDLGFKGMLARLNLVVDRILK